MIGRMPSLGVDWHHTAPVACRAVDRGERVCHTHRHAGLALRPLNERDPDERRHHDREPQKRDSSRNQRREDHLAILLTVVVDRTQDPNLHSTTRARKSGLEVAASIGAVGGPGQDRGEVHQNRMGDCWHIGVDFKRNHDPFRTRSDSSATPSSLSDTDPAPTTRRDHPQPHRPHRRSPNEQMARRSGKDCKSASNPPNANFSPSIAASNGPARQ